MPKSSIEEALRKARQKQSKNKESTIKSIHDYKSPIAKEKVPQYHGPYIPINTIETHEEDDSNSSVEDSLYVDSSRIITSSPRISSKVQEQPIDNETSSETSDWKFEKATEDSYGFNQYQKKQLEPESEPVPVPEPEPESELSLRRRTQMCTKPKPSGSLLRSSMERKHISETRKQEEVKEKEIIQEDKIVDSQIPNPVLKRNKTNACFNRDFIIFIVLVIMFICLVALCKKGVSADPEFSIQACTTNLGLCLSLIARDIRALLW